MKSRYMARDEFRIIIYNETQIRRIQNAVLSEFYYCYIDICCCLEFLFEMRYNTFLEMIFA